MQCPLTLATQNAHPISCNGRVLGRIEARVHGLPGLRLVNSPRGNSDCELTFSLALHIPPPLGVMAAKNCTFISGDPSSMKGSQVFFMNLPWTVEITHPHYHIAHEGGPLPGLP